MPWRIARNSCFLAATDRTTSATAGLGWNCALHACAGRRQHFGSGEWSVPPGLFDLLRILYHRGAWPASVVSMGLGTNAGCGSASGNALCMEVHNRTPISIPGARPLEPGVFPLSSED